MDSMSRTSSCVLWAAPFTPWAPSSMACVMELMEAGCSQPAAAFAEYRNGEIRLWAMFGNRRAEGTAPAEKRLELAAEIAGRLK